MGSHSLLQGIFPTQGSNPGLPHYRWILYLQSHKGSPGVGKVRCNTLSLSWNRPPRDVEGSAGSVCQKFTWRSPISGLSLYLIPAGQGRNATYRV